MQEPILSDARAIGNLAKRQLSVEQCATLDQISRWLRKGDAQEFKLAGHAGVGKTTLAGCVEQVFDGPVLHAAPTAKAAAVMRSKGCKDATTLHRLRYYPPEEHVNGRPLWVPRNERLDGALVVVDEASMVNVELGERLAEAGAAVLAILDPEQLPPVKGGAYFSGVPDVMLRQIHRQALNSPIITLSMSIREGAIPTARKIDWDLIEQGDVVLCAFNRTRRALNVEIRRRRHYRGLYPEDGECVVCLRNDYSRGVLNGVTYTVVGTRTIGVGGDNLKMIVRDDDGAEFEAVVPKECFASDIDPHTVRPELNPFDFGYCITCHKSQGSEWGRVVVIDESAEYARCAVGNTPGDWARKQMSKRWLYTAITRASERVDIMRSE